MEKDSEFEHLKMKGHRYSVLALGLCVTRRKKTKTKIILKIIGGFRIKDWLLTCDEQNIYLYDLCFPCTTVPLESVLQPFTVVFVSE